MTGVLTVEFHRRAFIRYFILELFTYIIDMQQIDKDLIVSSWLIYIIICMSPCFPPFLQRGTTYMT